MDNLTPVIQFFGSIPSRLLSDVLLSSEKHFPGCLALDASHALSRATRATLTIAIQIK